MTSENIEYREDFDWSTVSESDPFAIDIRKYGYAGYPRSLYAGVLLKRGIKVVIAPPTMGASILSHQSGVPYSRWRKSGKESIYDPWANDDFDEDFIATASELAEVMEEINGLAFQDESDDFGLLRPSYQAFLLCTKTMLGLVRDGELLRPSDISTDRNGDIRIAWTAEDKEAELVFPSNTSEAPYIYYSSPSSYGTVADTSPQTISKWVRWAIRNR